MKVVYAKQTVSVMMPEGYPILIPLGTHWAANDPVVVARPDLFSDDPKYGLFRPAPDENVETASANPGERRSVRRG